MDITQNIQNKIPNFVGFKNKNPHSLSSPPIFSRSDFFPLPKSNPSNLQAPRNLQNLVAISSKMARTKTTMKEVAGHAKEPVGGI